MTYSGLVLNSQYSLHTVSQVVAPLATFLHVCVSESLRWIAQGLFLFFVSLCMFWAHCCYSCCQLHKIYTFFFFLKDSLCGPMIQMNQLCLKMFSRTSFQIQRLQFSRETFLLNWKLFGLPMNSGGVCFENMNLKERKKNPPIWTGFGFLVIWHLNANRVEMSHYPE